MSERRLLAGLQPEAGLLAHPQDADLVTTQMRERCIHVLDVERDV